MAKIKEYFNFIADELDIKAQKAGLTNNASDIGFNREIIIKYFLEKHIPRRLKPILGGNVFGVSVPDSKQIDIIISNDISINFEEHSKMFVATESVTSAITIKSQLDKDAIFDCLENLASIPQIDPNILSFKILLPGSFENFVSKHPSLFIFAFDGLSLEKTLKHVQDFYSQNKTIPFNRYPQGIIVNKKFYINFSINGYSTSTGAIIPPHTFFGMPLESDLRGYPYIQMLNSISAYVDWLPFMRIDIHHYFNNQFGIEPKL